VAVNKPDPLSGLNAELKAKGFKVFEFCPERRVVPRYNRKDFYKICLNTGKNIIHYADRSFETEGSILFFGNPLVPYSWEKITEEDQGYACLFTEEFLKLGDRTESLQQSPLFQLTGTPILQVNSAQKDFISAVFRKMLVEQDTDYSFKDELIRNYINLIVHEALKMQPSQNFFKPKNASSRTTVLFLELLERQFPIESADQPLQLKTAHDFAESLSLHVNHLNRSVKENTGKSTSTLIAERIIVEARTLLLHTDWSVAEIAFALGFSYPELFQQLLQENHRHRPLGFTRCLNSIGSGLISVSAAKSN
jgi:AraC family transcriptional activator of pobA